MAFRSGNPALNARTFQEVTINDANDVMTLEGTVNKVGILLLTVILIAGFIMFAAPSSIIMPAWIIGIVGSLATGIVLAFNKTKAGVIAPIYAVFEGLFLGGLSKFAEMMYPGIVTQAVILTFGIFIALLAAYKSKLIKPSENFKLGLTAAIGGIGIFYLANFVMSMFGHGFAIMSSNSTLGIAINGVIVVIAALTLVLDFDFIEEGCEQGAPKYMEWYGAYGLLVSLVWLYVEILRLLMKLQSRR